MAMTKPLPFGSIKKKENPPTLVEFSRILDSLSHNDGIGHLFIIDIKFHNVNPKTLLFNELYPSIFEKDKKMEPFEQSTFQILSTIVRNEDNQKINSVQYNSKTHSTLKEKNSLLSTLKICIS